MEKQSEIKPPLSWLKKIEPALRQLDVSPLLGHQPAVDWDEVCKKLMHLFHLSDLTIETKQTAWRPFEEITKDFGHQSSILPLHVTPLEGELYWIMSNRDVQKLSSWALTQEKQSGVLQTFNLQEGFYRYLALETLDALFSTQPFTNLTPQIIPEVSLKEETLCFDVELKSGDEACVGRLAMSASFQKSWRHYFFSEEQSYYSETMAKSLELPLSLVVGEVSLDYTALSSVKPGDFIALDQASYDPKTHQGTVAMKLGSEHLFQAMLKQNKIKLLGSDVHNEEKVPMENPPPPEELETPQHPEPPEQPKNLDPSTPSEETSAPAEVAGPANEEKGINLKQLPLTVTVEIARFSMPLDKLMKLEPGNFLELPVHPSQGVALHVNGKKIGRAELVHLGEALGVRILELGK